MIYDAKGNEYRTIKTIGFRREPSLVLDLCDITVPKESGKLPDWTIEERSDGPVAAERKR